MAKEQSQTERTLLARVGKIGKYAPALRFASPQGTLFTRNAAVKLYAMTKLDANPFIESEIREYKEAVQKRLEDREIDPRIGLGFSILSEDAMNVVMWDKKVPSIAYPTLFTFEEGDFHPTHLIKRDIRSVGAFCAWELGIAGGHEAKAWQKYLRSCQREVDKREYLDCTHTGVVFI